MAKKRKSFERFGQLTVTGRTETESGDLLFICQCVCRQIVVAPEAELRTRRACRACEAAGASKLKPDDIAVYKNAIGGAIPFGEQVLIIETEGRNFAVEFRGKLYLCRADELDPTGINFFDSRRAVRRKMRKINGDLKLHIEDSRR